MFFLLIICVITRVYMSQILKCDNGWKFYKDKCYYFSETDSQKKTRDDAITYCHDNDAYLVAVTDADINNFLYSNRTHDDLYWIGLRPFAQDKWGWNDGSLADDIPWGNKEPNNDRPCVRIRDTLFLDRICTEDYTAVCERDTEPEATGNWTSYDGHWYRLTDKMSHLAAVKVCLSQDGYLARLTTDGERNLDLLPQNTLVWTGLTRLVWDGGPGYNWHFWRGDHNDEHPSNTMCAALGGGTGSWKSKECQDEYHFICNREPSVKGQPTTSATPTTEESTIVHYTISLELITQSTDSTKRNEMALQTSTLTINGTNNTEGQISNENQVLFYVLFAIYAMVIIMLLLDSVLLVIYMKVRKSSKSQVDDKSHIREADPATFGNNVYADLGDSILPTEQSDAPIYSIPQKSSIHV